MKQVYIARDRADADAVCQRLLASGLNAVVQGDGSGEGPAEGFASVWVSGEDAERAHELLREAAADGAEDEPV